SSPRSEANRHSQAQPSPWLQPLAAMKRKSRLCGFCQRADCNPEVLGQFCRQDGLCVHENCLYHASRLNQRGADEEGFYGFLFPDIQEELKRVAQKGQALRSALHYFCCPLCRDMVTFQKEMFRLGIKIPDRLVDAAWEENGAFADHYQRHSSCDSSPCLCPVGREVAEENGPWRLLLCHSCGSCGTHQRCSNLGEDVDSWECRDCSNTGTGEGCSWGAGHKVQRAM
uniref:PHF7/G2E3-like PHD zinc finger domain-containing protein n=1 Tax=Melopsittacus undulatus TaxID=13146 RepID=A0A8V5G7Q5_MELUD